MTKKKSTSTKKSTVKKSAASKKAAAKTKRAAAKKTKVKTKSTTTKKTVKAKTAKSSLRKGLLKDLNVICEALDEESLRFLVKQAGVLYHNKKVQEVTTESRKLTAKARNEAKENALNKLKGKGYGDKYSIKVKEGDDGSYFMIGVNNYRSFFAREEMKRLVRMCQAADNAADGARRMYTWFKNERGDILYNTDINGPTDPALKTIYDYIVKTYTVKD